MRSKAFIAFILLNCGYNCFAQKQDYNWCFGDSCGINFNGSMVTSFTSACHKDSAFINLTDWVEANAAISDGSGSLLFYTNSTQVWNKQHKLMPNGEGLYSNHSITNGVLILPMPSNDSLYYIFHLNQHLNNNFPPHGLYYSIVNMKADSGRGDVVTKNMQLDNSKVSEQLAAVKHANGRDWWIIHGEQGTKNYYEYLLTPTGVSFTVMQSVGSYSSQISWGEIVFSSGGNRLAVVNFEDSVFLSKLDLFDFDRCSGVISNLIDLSDTGSVLFNYLIGYYGCSFSPDGSKLYASTFNRLYEFDLNAADILSSKQLIWVNPYLDTFSVTGYLIGQHELGPDNKIYLTLTAGGEGVSTDTFIDKYLCVINKPNLMGSGCDFTPCSFDLGGHYNLAGLPNMPNYNLGPLVGSPCDTLFNSVSEVQAPISFFVSPNPCYNQLTIISSNYISLLLIENMLGQTVYEQTLPPFSGERQAAKSVDVSSLPAGIYLAELKTDIGIVVRKFVKQ